MAAVLVMHALVPDIRGQAVGWTVSTAAITGGLIFGVGAVVNGGCAFSTLTQLGAGKVAMVVTLLGFALGSTVDAHYLGWGSDAVHTVPYLMRAGQLDWRLNRGTSDMGPVGDVWFVARSTGRLDLAPAFGCQSLSAVERGRADGCCQCGALRLARHLAVHQDLGRRCATIGRHWG